MPFQLKCNFILNFRIKIYIKKITEIKNLFPGSRWNEWSQWLGSCGCDGYQYRRRSCQDNYPNVDCYGSSLEKRYCDEQPHCNDWNEWSDWQGDCCYGSQVRRQTCKSKDANLSCYPTNIEERGCNQTHSCVEWNSWGEYGQCNKRIRVKSRTCKTHEGEVTCDNAMKMQSCDFDGNHITNYNY